MIRRRFDRQFPLFVLYTLTATVKSILLLAMRYAPFVSGNQYMYAFTFGDAIMAGLTFGVIYEIFTYVFRNYAALTDLGTTVFRWATVILLVVAIALAWTTPGAGAGHLMSAFYTIQRSMNILECGLLLFLVLFSRYFGLSLRSYVFGIALGLGILASVSLALSSIRSQIEPTVWQFDNRFMNLIGEAAYLCSVLVWTVFLLAPERRPNVLVKALPEHDLESWNEELQRLLHQ